MRRAVIATAGTVVGLVVLLGYKSSGPVNLQKVSVGTGSPGATTTTPATEPSTAPAPGGATPSTSAPTGAKTATYTGHLVVYLYGDIQVAVTLSGGRIVSVSVPQNAAADGRSAAINSEAVPVLVQETLAAQGTNIDVVTGATYTSDAFAQSLQTALTKADV
jgi:uncharacterized protein with FMN-binding domain